MSRGDLRDTHTCTHMRTHIACIHTLPHPHRHACAHNPHRYKDTITLTDTHKPALLANISL